MEEACWKQNFSRSGLSVCKVQELILDRNCKDINYEHSSDVDSKVR